MQSTILIVDDEPFGRATLDGLLRPCGYRLLYAASGSEALSCAAVSRPDLILLDVMMPGMDGFAVCRQLRAEPATAEIPILLVTALDDRDSLLQGIEAGADDFIAKPFDRVELRARVQTITRLNRYRQLVHTRECFAWVVKQAVEGYVIIDANDAIVYANPQARRYLGLPCEAQVAPTTFRDAARQLYHSEPQAAWECWPAAPAQNAPRYLVLPESPGTRAFWLEVEVLALPEGLASGQLIRLRDVTAQVVLHREMRSFHSLISHKLRTPLAGLVMSAELIEQRFENISQMQQVELARIVGSSARRLREQVDDIMQYINIPALATPSEAMRLVQLSGIVEAIAPALDLAEIAVACPADLAQQYTMLSQHAMRLIVWEICENSKKFHPRNAPKLELLLTRSAQGMLCMEFRDDGIRLPPEQLALAWTPYYQGEKEFTGQLKGMGLGLSLVATLVWSVGGSCVIENRVDAPGVVVALTVPLAGTKMERGA